MTKTAGAENNGNGWVKLEKLREWVKLGIVVTGLGCISWTMAQRDINDNSKSIARMDECIRQLQDELRRVSTSGPGGLVDPSIHSAMDTHITHYFRECLGVRGFRRLQDDYCSVGEYEHATD